MRPTPESSSASEKNAAFLEWICDELAILAEAFGETALTDARREIYAGGLSDIPRDRLKVAFSRALYESKFFPKLAELRTLSGQSAADEKKVEAEAAWRYVNEYLRKWGVNRLPIRSSGKWITAPSLEPRLEYAVRQIGGLWRLNQLTDENFPFIFRDFCEAYALAPLAELMAPQLAERFGDRKLLGNIKQLTEVQETTRPASEQEPTKAEGSFGRDR